MVQTLHDFAKVFARTWLFPLTIDRSCTTHSAASNTSCSVEVVEKEGLLSVCFSSTTSSFTLYFSKIKTQYKFRKKTYTYKNRPTFFKGSVRPFTFNKQFPSACCTIAIVIHCHPGMLWKVSRHQQQQGNDIFFHDTTWNYRTLTWNLKMPHILEKGDIISSHNNPFSGSTIFVFGWFILYIFL